MRMMMLLAVGLLGLTAVACEEGTTVVNTPGSTSTGVTVSATGSAFGSPDLARLSLGVQAEATTVADAREQAAASADAIINSVKGNGVADRDVRTVQFTVTPLYESTTRNGNPAIRGYRVTNVISVNVRDIDRVGEVLDDAVAAGGNNTIVRNIAFTIEDSEELKAAARKDAMARARAKANQLASEAGVDLGKPMSIIESEGYVPSPAFSGAELARAADTATPIESGELEVNITVTVLYGIE